MIFHHINFYSLPCLHHFILHFFNNSLIYSTLTHYIISSTLTYYIQYLLSYILFSCTRTSNNITPNTLFLNNLTPYTINPYALSSYTLSPCMLLSNILTPTTLTSNSLTHKLLIHQYLNS